MSDDAQSDEPPPGQFRIPRKPGMSDRQYAFLQEALKKARTPIPEAELKEFAEKREQWERMQAERAQEAEVKAGEREEKLEQVMTPKSRHQETPRPNDAPAQLPEVMTIDQAAEYLQLHRQVLYRYVRNGAVPAARIGGAIRFKKSVLDAWLEHGSWEHVREYVAYAKRQRTRTQKKSDETESPAARRRHSEDID